MTTWNFVVLPEWNLTTNIPIMGVSTCVKGYLTKITKMFCFDSMHTLIYHKNLHSKIFRLLWACIISHAKDLYEMKFKKIISIDRIVINTFTNQSRIIWLIIIIIIKKIIMPMWV